jgi:hypothetical protein
VERVRRILIYAAAAILAVALVRQFYKLGGPYFEAPETIQDHVAKETYPSRDAIVMARRAALLIPRGATVTVLLPSQAPNYDPTLYFTATGLMPRHSVVPPSASPQYIITVREPLNDASYAVQNEFDEGKIYVKR